MFLVVKPKLDAILWCHLPIIPVFKGRQPITMQVKGRLLNLRHSHWFLQVVRGDIILTHDIKLQRT